MHVKGYELIYEFVIIQLGQSIFSFLVAAHVVKYALVLFVTHLFFRYKHVLIQTFYFFITLMIGCHIEFHIIVLGEKVLG